MFPLPFAWKCMSIHTPPHVQTYTQGMHKVNIKLLLSDVMVITVRHKSSWDMTSIASNIVIHHKVMKHSNYSLQSIYMGKKI